MLVCVSFVHMKDNNMMGFHKCMHINVCNQKKRGKKILKTILLIWFHIRVYEVMHFICILHTARL